MSQEWNSEKYAKEASYVSELGLPVVSLLAPQSGENILDLGCGDGTLAKKIASCGCDVTGVDFSEAMVLSAQQKGIHALCQSGENLSFENKFDAVFSNAALHWMKNYNAVINGVHASLRSNGRFVAEFGGYGNIQSITDAISRVFENNPQFGQYESPWFFPSADEYAKLLEQHGFSVNSIELIDRPTPLNSGIREWLTIFAEHAMASLDEASKMTFLEQVEAIVKPKLYTEKEGWVADYVRLRFSATKA